MNNEMSAAQAIPQDVALRLCAEIRAAHHNRWFSAAHWQCWGCVTFTRGVPAKMCLSSRPGCRGCSLINARYERMSRTPD